VPNESPGCCPTTWRRRQLIASTTAVRLSHSTRACADSPATGAVTTSSLLSAPTRPLRPAPERRRGWIAAHVWVSVAAEGRGVLCGATAPATRTGGSLASTPLPRHQMRVVVDRPPAPAIEQAILRERGEISRRAAKVVVSSLDEEGRPVPQVGCPPPRGWTSRRSWEPEVEAKGQRIRLLVRHQCRILRPATRPGSPTQAAPARLPAVDHAHRGHSRPDRRRLGSESRHYRVLRQRRTASGWFLPYEPRTTSQAASATATATCPATTAFRIDQ
jgi:hypothetical protein